MLHEKTSSSPFSVPALQRRSSQPNRERHVVFRLVVEEVLLMELKPNAMQALCTAAATHLQKDHPAADDVKAARHVVQEALADAQLPPRAGAHAEGSGRAARLHWHFKAYGTR